MYNVWALVFGLCNYLDDSGNTLLLHPYSEESGTNMEMMVYRYLYPNCIYVLLMQTALLALPQSSMCISLGRENVTKTALQRALPQLLGATKLVQSAQMLLGSHHHSIR